MIHWLFDLKTGLFTGRSMIATDEILDSNRPDGFSWAEYVTDPQSQKVDLDIYAELVELQDIQGDIDQLKKSVIVDYTPPSPEPSDDYEWNADSRRWRKRTDAILRDQSRAAALAEINHLEINVQPRAIRELQLARLDSTQPDPETVVRLRQVDRRIAELRAQLELSDQSGIDAQPARRT